MPDIARLYNFLAGTAIVADQVDAELDQLVATINALTSDNLADNAVTAAKILAGAVTQPKISTPNVNSGYAQLGNLMVQWGSGTFAGSGAGQRFQAVAFPGGAFTVAPAAIVTCGWASVLDSHGIHQATLAASGFTAFCNVWEPSAGDIPFTWVAVGRKT